jgi:putative flippase GtrA
VGEASRFIGNGLFATVVHFSILTFAMEVLHVPLAAVANFIAAIFGITVSFLGNRYFVFRAQTEPIVAQAMAFAGLYLSIAAMHGAMLLVLSDWLKADYRVGFCIATIVQTAVSYLGNRHLVFAK